MSPEYAVHGQYSIKSDVFSFGVLILEIVSGKKNRGFSHPEHHHNLLGHVSKKNSILLNYVAKLNFLFTNALLIVLCKLDCRSTHVTIILICFRHGDYGLKVGQLNWSITQLVTSLYPKCYDAFMWVCYVCNKDQKIGQTCHLWF